VEYYGDTWSRAAAMIVGGELAVVLGSDLMLHTLKELDATWDTDKITIVRKSMLLLELIISPFS